MHPIHIRPVLNGWIVKVACQEILFTNLNNMVAEISQYLADPQRVEKHYLATSCNAIHMSTLANQVGGDTCGMVEAKQLNPVNRR